MVSQTVRSASLSQQGAEPGGVQAPQPKASQAEGVVVQVQSQSAQQQDDRGSVAPLHTHSQCPAEVLLVGAPAEQELHQLQGSASLTHLRKCEDTGAKVKATMRGYFINYVSDPCNLKGKKTENA